MGFCLFGPSIMNGTFLLKYKGQAHIVRDECQGDQAPVHSGCQTLSRCDCVQHQARLAQLLGDTIQTLATLQECVRRE